MKILLSLLLMAALSFMSVSCAQTTAPEDVPCYGTPAESSLLLFLCNEAGEDITELRINPVIQADEAKTEALPDLLEEDDFPAGAKIGVWFGLPLDGGQGDAALYEIMFTFTDGEVWTLHNVPVTDIGEAVLRRDENVIWLIYTSLTTGQEISTWLDELNILAEQEADSSVLEDDADPEGNAEDDDWNS